ncbi:MAG TPA: DUF488 domain-containing protein [Egibacteraceae bacterium]|nr:DUF488 domain-containing protein [Egibacteraceae bacterium]
MEARDRQRPVPALLTVGHGTLDEDALAALLTAAGVAAVVDVRRFPGSRRHPQFRREALADWLPRHGVAYRWEETLGGRRRGDATSPHVGLRDAAFRAYADHMTGAAFWDALDGVLAQAREVTTAVLCAESVWWRCHRRLVADAALLVRATPVLHLSHDGRRQAHPPTPTVRRDGDRLVYDRGEDRPLPGAERRSP